jgi:hypothetical protein
MENKHDYLFLFLLVVIAPVLEMVRRNDWSYFKDVFDINTLVLFYNK